MSRLNALLLVMVAVRYFQSTPAWAQTEKEKYPFAVHFSEEVDIRNVQLRYFIVGKFGGYGEFAFDTSDEHTILLHTEVKGVPAASLKAFLYVPGCQIATIDVPELAKSSRELSFECHPLPTIAFTGKIESGQPVTDPQPVVDVRYMAIWGLTFFGTPDSIVPAIHIATVPLEPTSVFHVTLPDFSKDAVTSSYEADPLNARLNFMLRNAKTWNILGLLVPQGSRSQFADLPIRSKYPPEVVFTLHKM